MEFRQIRNIGNVDFHNAMEIYSSAFPSNERHTVEVIMERVAKGLSQLYAGWSGDEIVFVALLWPLRDTDFILLDYMATHEKHRGKRIASLFLQDMRKFLKDKKKYFILEVEDPEYGDNKEEREKRIAFYRKNGAKLINGLRYELPPLQGTSPTEMLLMIFPGYSGETIEAVVVRNLIVQIYRELYAKDADEMLSRYFHFDKDCFNLS